jgi:predicted DNA-binding protein (MmcQ/YjbR family)
MNSTQLRALIGAWPGVTEDLKWGNDLVFSVGEKMFCVIDATPAAEGGNGRLSFKVDDDRFLELTDRPGIVPAPYLARAKWICMAEPDAMSDAELAPLLRRSYALVRAKLTKAKQRELGEG